MKAGICSLLIIGLVTSPCYATQSMAFQSLDQYIEKATNTWIVEVSKRTATKHHFGDVYETKVLQSLKGDAEKKTVSITGVFHGLVPGQRFLFFAFNQNAQDGQTHVWIDNGLVSPVPLALTFSLNDLENKSAKDQVAAVMQARRDDIVSQMRQSTREKARLEQGLGPAAPRATAPIKP